MFSKSINSHMLNESAVLDHAELPLIDWYLFFSTPQTIAGSSNTIIRCRCNHLTTFGGAFLVAPNPIDFDRVFLEITRLELDGNIAVLSTIIALLLLYLIVLVIARREDKKDQIMVSIKEK